MEMEHTVEELLQLSYRLVYKLVRKHDDEYLSAAGFAVQHAISEYNESLGVPLDKWIMFCVARAVRGEQKKNRRFLFSDELFWKNREARADSCFFEIVDLLGPKEAELAREHFIEQIGVKELAEMYGTTKHLIRVRLDRIRRKLREFL